MKMKIAVAVWVSSVLAFVLGLLGVAVAQTPPLPASQPVWSKGALRSYAYSAVENGSLQIYGGIVLENAGTTFVSERQNVPGDAQHLINLLASKRLDFSFAEPKTGDTVNVYGALRSAVGHQLFWAHRSFELVKKPEGWSVPNSARTLEWDMVSEIPLPFEGVVSARVALRHNGALSEKRDLRVEGGFYAFPVELAGKVGQLEITTPVKGGDQVTVFNLAGEGERLATYQGGVYCGGFMKDVYIFRESGKIHLAVERGSLLVFQLDKESVFNYQIEDRDGIPPIAVFARKAIGGSWLMTTMNPPKGSFLSIHFPKGDWHLVPVWTPEEAEMMGGGKG